MFNLKHRQPELFHCLKNTILLTRIGRSTNDAATDMKILIFIILLFALFFLNSCVREKATPCPPLQVNILVKDKNYFNVSDLNLKEYKNEALAFREYVPTLYYMLRDATTGKVMEQQDVFPVEGDSKTVSVTFCDCLPFGKYILTIWGGLDNSSTPVPGSLLIELHSLNQEGTDSYLANDTLIYNEDNYAYSVDLERTKGKLVIQTENLPNQFNFSEKSINGIFHYVDPGFNYSGTTTVVTQTSFSRSSIVETNTMLAPSPKENAAIIGVNLYSRTDLINPALTSTIVNTTIKRNELTLLKYVYNDDTQNFTIYIYLNDSWNIIYDMDIN